MKGLKQFVRRSMRALIRRSVRPEAAELLLNDDQDLSDGTLQWLARLVVERGFDQSLSKQVVRVGTDPYDGQNLKMPLIQSINSNDFQASFFNGENALVMQGSYISPDAEIGGCTYIGFRCHITKAKIGRYTSIADGVIIGPGEHALTEISTNSIFYDDAYSELTKLPVDIGPDVWIGADSIVRRGVSIGLGAVIGANSFVNTDIPAFAIAVGSPARVIAYRISGESALAVANSKWWEQPVDIARKMISDLESAGVVVKRSTISSAADRSGEARPKNDKI